MLWNLPLTCRRLFVFVVVLAIFVPPVTDRSVSACRDGRGKLNSTQHSTTTFKTTSVRPTRESLRSRERIVSRGRFPPNKQRSHSDTLQKRVPARFADVIN